MNSYWIDSTKNEGIFQTLENDTSCDVLIIGAGMFGLSTAYYLSKKGLNVIIVDKSNIGSKVSGHTTAKITSQHGLIYNYLVNSFNKNIAKKYLDANEESIRNIRNIVNNENIQCDLETQNAYVYANKHDDIEKIKKEIKAVKSLDFNAQYIEHVPVPFENYGAIMFPNQAMFHPRKYMLGLCRCIISNSGKIYSNTTIHDIRKCENFYKTFAYNNVIKSKYIVLASHYPFINFPGFYFTKMYQETSYILGINTNSPLFNGMYISASAPTYSYRTTRAGNKEILLLGGSSHKTGLENISTYSTYDILEQKAKELFNNCEILYKWNTRDCITLDKIPYIGSFSNLMPNMYIGTGFNKWGMTSSNVAANIITDKILGLDNKYEDAFTSTRIKPIKNIEEMKSMLKQSGTSLIIEKIKISDATIKKIKNDSGSIIEVNGAKIGIYKDKIGKLFAVKPICTHLGCLLNWNNVDKTWDCPCHGSRFDYKGKNIYDPAFKNLKAYNL